MASPVFDTSKCGLPLILPSDDPLLIDDTVPDAPEPILDCLAVPPSPTADVPCPELRTGNSNFTFGGPPGTPASGQITVRQGACCDFDFDLDLHVPCSSFTPPSQTKPVPFRDDPHAGQLTLNIRQQSPDSCDFDFDINVDVPCPLLASIAESKPAPFVDSESRIQLIVTKQPDCEYDFDIDLDIHCPALQPAAQTHAVGFADGPQGSATLTITRAGDQCDYDFDINVQAPCATLTTERARPVPFTAGAGSAQILLAKNPNCEYDFDIDVKVHCGQLASLTEPTGKAVGFTAGTGRAHLLVTPKPDCDYDFDFNINVHCGQLKPASSAKTVPFRTGGPGAGHATLTIAPNGSQCDYDFDLSIEAPCIDLQPPTQAHAVPFAADNGSAGSASLTITRANDCDYNFDLEITAPCMTLTSNVPSQVHTIPTGPGYLQVNIRKNAAAHACDYDFDIQLYLPPSGSGGGSGAVRFPARILNCGVNGQHDWVALAEAANGDWQDSPTGPQGNNAFAFDLKNVPKDTRVDLTQRDDGTYWFAPPADRKWRLGKILNSTATGYQIEFLDDTDVNAVYDATDINNVVEAEADTIVFVWTDPSDCSYKFDYHRRTLWARVTSCNTVDDRPVYGWEEQQKQGDGSMARLEGGLTGSSVGDTLENPLFEANDNILAIDDLVLIEPLSHRDDGGGSVNWVCDSESGGPRLVRVVNNSSATIPAWGVLGSVGTDADDITYLTTLPTDDSQMAVLLNGPNPLPAHGCGSATRDFPALSLYETGDGSPAIGDLWGPEAGSARLRRGYPGFIIVGDPLPETTAGANDQRVPVIPLVPGSAVVSITSAVRDASGYQAGIRTAHEPTTGSYQPLTTAVRVSDITSSVNPLPIGNYLGVFVAKPPGGTPIYGTSPGAKTDGYTGAVTALSNFSCVDGVMTATSSTMNFADGILKTVT